MATHSKKTNTSSSNSRKRSHKRRKPVKKTLSNANAKKSILIVLGVFLMISMVAFGYFLGKYELENNTTKFTKKEENKKVLEEKNRVHDLSKIKKDAPKVTKEVSITRKLSDSVPSVDDKTTKEKEKPQIVKTALKVQMKNTSGKPKLAIIIDDVSNARQLRDIQALHMKITPSIFPPSERSMKSHTLARGLTHYMIHLPMESGSKQFNKQYKTLKIAFDKEQMVARAKELRVLFPTAKYINNHTGSVFTDDYNAMFTLYSALKAEDFVFVDSRTIASTKLPKITQEFGDAYIARDTFIDNVHNVGSIHKQLRKAVEIAKRKGYAIAIGHPYSITMQALLSAKNIFNDVELVYIDDLMTI